MKEKIKEMILDSIETKKKVSKILIPKIEKASEIIIESLKNGKKILICGNGGSAADSQHFAAELLVRYEKNRRSLPAIALNTDTSTITACSNDFGYNKIFSKQVEGLGNKGDILIGITTSGNSENILEAFKIAKKKNIKCICLSGNGGGKTREISLDLNIIIPSEKTARIQESHILIIHIISKIVEDYFTQ